MPPPLLRFLKNGPLLLLVSSVFIGGMAVTVKLACRYLPTGEVVFLRFLGGLLIIWPLARVGIIRVTVHNRKLTCLRGVLSAVAILTYFNAIARLPVAHAVLLQNTYPLFIAALSIPLLGERAGFDTLACFLITFGGIALMLHPSGGASGVALMGYVFGIVSATFAAGAVMTTRVLRKTDSAVSIFYYFSLIGSLLSLPAALVHPIVPKGVGLAAIALTIVFSIAGQLLLNQAFKYTRAAEGSVVMMASTAVAATLGAWVFGDRYGGGFFVGAALIFASIAWITAKTREAAPLPAAMEQAPPA